MNNEIKKEMQKALNSADMSLLSMLNIIGNLDVWRDKSADTWADVGTMKHIVDKIEEICKELEQYGNRRLPEDD